MMQHTIALARDLRISAKKMQTASQVQQGFGFKDTAKALDSDAEILLRIVDQLDEALAADDANV